MSIKTKVCADCGIEKSVNDFYTYTHGERKTVYARCKICQNIRIRAKPRGPRNEKRREYNRKSYETINQIKSVPCADCGVQYPPYVMDLDHLGDDKVLNISSMISKNWSLKTILKEVQKCEVVCANCHRIRTHERKNAMKDQGMLK